jgi:hypothetical protein
LTHCWIMADGIVNENGKKFKRLMQTINSPLDSGHFERVGLSPEDRSPDGTPSFKFSRDRGLTELMEKRFSNF